MKLTDRYVDLCRQLAEAGYVWQPRPGDWMLDIADESIGMITTYIHKPELLRKVNIQLPYGEQISSMLAELEIQQLTSDDSVSWSTHAGTEIYSCDTRAYEDNPDEEALAALVAAYRDRPQQRGARV